MLIGNLATRPFYNERLIRGVLTVALAGAAAWAAVNAATVVSLSQQGSMLGERVRSEGLRAAAARADADGVRKGLDAAQLKGVARSATEANLLIQQRTFSWTELFNQFEATLPPDVRLVQVQPQADDEGRLMVALSVISRRIEDLDAFIEQLEATGTFRGVLSRSDETLEDGTIQSSLQGYYRHAAIPAPAASDPKSAAATGVRAEGGR
jgi:Tfp pilus assembly protein PilN